VIHPGRTAGPTRFAWSWKLTELGVPMVLVYLGFLNAVEMADRGKPFRSHADWDALVRAESEPVCPAGIWIWDRRWDVHGQAFVPLIRSLELALDQEVA
jgi:hypothetical protein